MLLQIRGIRHTEECAQQDWRQGHGQKRLRAIRNCFTCGKLELNILATFDTARRDPNGFEPTFVEGSRVAVGKRFVVHADEKVTAMLELERAICLHLLSEQNKS